MNLDLEKSSNWYQELILDIKKLEFTGIVLTKHAIGKRILLDFDKFGKPGYGSKQIVNIANDLEMSKADLYSCLQFAKKYPELSDGVRQFSWRKIVHELLPAPKPSKESIPPIPQKDYDVIVIDPPWGVEFGLRDVRPLQSQFGMQYPTMEEEEIAAVELPANEDCHIFLWTVQSKIHEAFRLLEAWQLKHICIFTWHKPGGFQPFNLPQYNSEFVLYARKGAPKFIDTKAFSTCFDAPRGGHSEKPAYFYEMVERVTKGKRLDMFARKQHPGFDSWGNEVNQGIREASA